MIASLHFISEFCIDIKQSVCFLLECFLFANHETCFKIGDLSHLFRNFLDLVMSFWVDRIKRETFLTKVWTSFSKVTLTAKQIDSGENTIFNKLFDLKNIFLPFIFHLCLVWGACTLVCGVHVFLDFFFSFYSQRLDHSQIKIVRCGKSGWTMPW